MWIYLFHVPAGYFNPLFLMIKDGVVRALRENSDNFLISNLISAGATEIDNNDLNIRSRAEIQNDNL
jgi:hypothetical protein